MALPTPWFQTSVFPSHWSIISTVDFLFVCSFSFLAASSLSCRRRQWHPLQHSCLENPMDGGAWKAAVHGVAEGWAWLNNFTFTFHFHALEKEMATHFDVLVWRIPGMGEPGGLPSLGSHRVGHDWSDLAAAVAAVLAAACGIFTAVHRLSS